VGDTVDPKGGLGFAKGTRCCFDRLRGGYRPFPWVTAAAFWRITETPPPHETLIAMHEFESLWRAVFRCAAQRSPTDDDKTNAGSPSSIRCGRCRYARSPGHGPVLVARRSVGSSPTAPTGRIGSPGAVSQGRFTRHCGEEIPIFNCFGDPDQANKRNSAPTGENPFTPAGGSGSCAG
jgi:hypothetical protein